MGVKCLFDILEPADREVDIAELCGKTLALDISTWIVGLWQNGNAKNLSNEICMRHVFTRILHFLKQGVNLVVVADGVAPDIKQGTLKQRQQNSTPNSNRPWLQNLTSQVKELFQYFGIPCLTSWGEAEALCAYLDRMGIVDGSITDDSDYLCYGGKTLYRNLRKDKKNYVVDTYTMEKIATDKNLDQDDLIALALLIGCDYIVKGVPHVGPEKGLKLVQHLKEKKENPLDRLCGWPENKMLDVIKQELNQKIKKNSHCKTCDHLGSLSSHEKHGCQVCCTKTTCLNSSDQSHDQSCDCEWHMQQVKAKQFQLEIGVRHSALQEYDVGFAEICNKVIQEFKKSPPRDTKYDTQQQPFKLTDLVRSAGRMLAFDAEKVSNELVAMVIYYQLRGGAHLTYDMFTPVRIHKECKENHVLCYKLLWDKTDRNTWLKDEQGTNIELNVKCDLFASKYPAMVRQYQEKMETKRKSKGKKKKPAETDSKQQTLTSWTQPATKKLKFD